MGIVTKGLTAAVLTFGLSATAFATEYTASDDSLESNLCVAAATDSKFAMHNKIKKFRTTSFVSKNYDLIANHLVCNGMPITEFALEAGNSEVAEKLAKYEDSNTVKIRDIANVRHGHVHIGSL